MRGIFRWIMNVSGPTQEIGGSVSVNPFTQPPMQTVGSEFFLAAAVIPGTVPRIVTVVPAGPDVGVNLIVAVDLAAARGVPYPTLVSASVASRTPAHRQTPPTLPHRVPRLIASLRILGKSHPTIQPGEHFPFPVVTTDADARDSVGPDLSQGLTTQNENWLRIARGVAAVDGLPSDCGGYSGLIEMVLRTGYSLA